MATKYSTQALKLPALFCGTQYLEKTVKTPLMGETTGLNVRAFPEYRENSREISLPTFQSTVLRHASSHHKRHGAILMFRFVGADVKQQKCPTCNTSNAVNFV